MNYKQLLEFKNDLNSIDGYLIGAANSERFGNKDKEILNLIRRVNANVLILAEELKSTN